MKDKVLILFGKRLRKESLRQFDKLLHANCLAYNKTKQIWECVTLNSEKK